MNSDFKKSEQAGNSRSRENGSDSFYECVEPELGADLDKLDAPDTDQTLRRQLENHIEVCDACRFEIAVNKNVARGLQTGRYRISSSIGWLETLRNFLSPPGRESWAGAMQTVSSISFSACVLLVFLLPPTAPQFGSGQRGPDQEPRFERPVEGEVVLNANPTLSWEPIEEASGYRITLDNAGGGYEWYGQTRENEITVPSGSPVPLDDRLRAILEPIPPDLAPSGGYSLSFRRGNLIDFIGYRVKAASLLLKLCGSLSLVSLITALAVITKR